MHNDRSTPSGARVAAPNAMSRLPYTAPAVRPLGTVRGRTQWSPNECAAIDLPYPCDHLL